LANWRAITARVQDVAGDLPAITVDNTLDAARTGDVSRFPYSGTPRNTRHGRCEPRVVADPEMLVLGGMMASASDLLEPRVELAAPAEADYGCAEVTPLGADAVSVGAVGRCVHDRPAGRFAGAARSHPPARWSSKTDELPKSVPRAVG
jgi:hypothetical protein